MIHTNFRGRATKFVAITGLTLGLMSGAAQADGAGLPQFQVAGTDIKLHNGVRAQKVGALVDAAQAAIAACDKSSYDTARRALSSEYESAHGLADGPATLFFVDADEKDAVEVNSLRTNLNKQWSAKCGGAAQSGTTFSASAGISVGQFFAPRMGFLGLENPGTLAQTIGVVYVEEDARLTSGDIEGSVHFGQTSLFGSNGLWVAAGYNRATSNFRYGMNTFDPNGDTLLIPGPTGGASGFSLVTAGGLNVVSNLAYEADFEWDSAFVKGGLPFDCGDWDFMPFAGVAYTELEYMSNFSGSVVGFGRDFSYRTNLYVDTISPFVGFAASRDLGNGVSLNGGGLASADFNDIEGRDRLSFTGVADSQQNLDDDDTTFGGRAWGGLTFGTKESPLKVSLGASYIYTDNIPVVNRDGTNPSSVSLDSGEAVTVRLGARVRF